MGDRYYLDMFTFYASRPVAFNHPMLRDEGYISDYRCERDSSQVM